MKRGLTALAAAMAAALLLLPAGCRKTPAAAGAPAGPRVEEMSWGPVQIAFTADPPAVDLSRDLLLTVRVTAPPEMRVVLPAIDDRLQGFVAAGVYDDEPYAQGGKTVRVRHCKLTPCSPTATASRPWPSSTRTRP
jgi:hypothetical protein